MEISKTKANLFSGLSNKKMREKSGLFMAEGKKCVLDTLGAFELVNLVATEEWLERNGKITGSLEQEKILTAREDVIKKISSLSTPSDVIAVFKIPQQTEISLSEDELYLFLDGIQDPGNLGTIIRTADWFGFDKVICSKNTVDVFNPKTIQSTMGSLKRVKIFYDDLEKLLIDGKTKRIYGTLLEGENIFKKKLDKSGVIIMGNEGNGISECLRRLISDPLFIPPYREESHAESLNVAIATAITLAQFRK